jgi:HEAT repeat protein
LADGEGNDKYLSYQYAQGCGTHMTAGCIYDGSGNDLYSGKGLMQGVGHDRSVAICYDACGDDNYVASDLSQGAGSANGIGIQADLSGNDSYIVKSANNTRGFGDARRDYGSIGIFIDVTGKDSMPAEMAPIPPGGAAQTGELALINNRIEKLAAASIAAFIVFGFEYSISQTNQATIAEGQYAKIVDSLWIRAASGDIKFKDQVEPSKKSIIEMGTQAIPRMLTKLNTRDAREMQTAIDIFKGIGEPAIDPLSKLVNDNDPFTRRTSIRCLEEIKNPRAIDPLLTVVNHDDFRTRAAAISALGSIGDSRAGDAVMKALIDNNELVATAAAVACGKIKTGINIQLLIGALMHPYYVYATAPPGRWHR